MNILLNVSWQIEVDDVLDVRDIQTSGGNGGGNDDGRLPSLKPTYEKTLLSIIRVVKGNRPSEGLLALALGPVPVDARHGETLAVEKLVQLVGAFLGFNEDESTTGLAV